MKKGNINILFIGCVSLLAACAPKIQTYDLNQDYATSLHIEGTEDKKETKGPVEEEKSDLVGVPFRNFYGGDLKRGGVWFGGKGIAIEKGDVFMFDVENAGPDSLAVGATFQPLDLAKEEVRIKISARATGNVSPLLALELKDIDGFMTNAKWPSQKIEISEEFKDYYFDTKDIFVQNMPKKHKVNGSMINNLKFYVNPGQQPAFTGQIYVKEIKVIPVKQ